MPLLWWSVQARNNWAALPMNCSKIGHSYEAFTYLFGRDILICLLSAKEFSCRSSKISNHWKILNNPLFWDYSFFPQLLRSLLVESRIYILAVSPLIHMSQISGFVRSMIMSWYCLYCRMNISVNVTAEENLSLGSLAAQVCVMTGWGSGMKPMHIHHSYGYVCQLRSPAQNSLP